MMIMMIADAAFYCSERYAPPPPPTRCRRGLYRRRGTASTRRGSLRWPSRRCVARRRFPANPPFPFPAGTAFAALAASVQEQALVERIREVTRRLEHLEEWPDALFEAQVVQGPGYVLEDVEVLRLEELDESREHAEVNHWTSRLRATSDVSQGAAGEHDALVEHGRQGIFLLLFLFLLAGIHGHLWAQHCTERGDGPRLEDLHRQGL